MYPKRSKLHYPIREAPYNLLEPQAAFVNIFAKLSIVLHVLRWRIRWTRHNLNYIPRGLNPQLFISGRQAAAIIPDHATVASCGLLAANTACSASALVAG